MRQDRKEQIPADIYNIIKEALISLSDESAKYHEADDSSGPLMAGFTANTYKPDEAEAAMKQLAKIIKRAAFDPEFNLFFAETDLEKNAYVVEFKDSENAELHYQVLKALLPECQRILENQFEPQKAEKKERKIPIKSGGPDTVVKPTSIRAMKSGRSIVLTDDKSVITQDVRNRDFSLNLVSAELLNLRDGKYEPQFETHDDVTGVAVPMNMNATQLGVQLTEQHAKVIAINICAAINSLVKQTLLPSEFGNAAYFEHNLGPSNQNIQPIKIGFPMATSPEAVAEMFKDNYNLIVMEVANKLMPAHPQRYLN